MKTKGLSVVRIQVFIALFISCLGLSLHAQESTKYITINGSAKDAKSKKKIEYASVTIPGTNISTVTNTDGEFSVKIKEGIKASELEISHIGYFTIRQPIESKDYDNLEIYLQPNITKLKDVVIDMVEPRQLVEKAIRKVGDNYNSTPSLLTGFYRETIKKGRGYIDISEAVAEVYKTPYNNKSNTNLDKVQILKSRSLLSPKSGDTLIVKLLGGPNLSIHLDMVKNPDLILDLKTIDDYKYKYKGTVFIDDKPHYIIEFKPQVIAPYPLSEGTLYIDQETLTFSRAEFKLNMDDRSKITQSILKKKPAKLHFKPEEVAYLVTYKERNGRSYLHYVRSEVRFKCDWKKKFFFFSTNYAVVSEMVTTDENINNISNIPRKLAFKENQSLSDKALDFYDINFWDDYNIIPPTESLESAINKLKKQYK